MPPRAGRWLEFIFASPVVLWGGWPFFVRGWQSLANRSPNMFTLISLGTGVAYVYSVVAILLPDLFPASFRSATGQVDLYFEAAAVIVTLVLAGQVMELRARSKTGEAIKALSLSSRTTIDSSLVPSVETPLVKCPPSGCVSQEKSSVPSADQPRGVSSVSVIRIGCSGPPTRTSLK